MSREAVIVSAARTPIGKAYRGAYNNLCGASLGAASVREAVARAGVEPAEVDDVIMGCALQQGATGRNIGRQTALRAGMPVSTSGMTVDRQCSSGMMAIAIAAKSVVCDGVDIAVGGGVESVSLVQNEQMNRHRGDDPESIGDAPTYSHADVADCRSGGGPLWDQSRAAGRIRFAVAATGLCRGTGGAGARGAGPGYCGQNRHRSSDRRAKREGGHTVHG